MELNAIKGKRGSICIYFSPAVGLRGKQIGNVGLSVITFCLKVSRGDS